MEYGWNRVHPLDDGRSPSNDSIREIDRSDSTSVRSSRSTRSRLRWKDGIGTVRTSHSPYTDKVYINDWKPPLPPTVSSVHDEESQMEALQKHVSSMKKDLQRHNELRQPMAALVFHILHVHSVFQLIIFFLSTHPVRAMLSNRKATGKKNPSTFSPRLSNMTLILIRCKQR